MNRILLSVIVVLVIMSASVLAEESELRVFAIGGRQLTSEISFTSVNFLVRNGQGDNIWSFNGPRYWFGQGGFVDAFIGLTFLQTGQGTFALSPRLRLPIGRFYLWQDVEWYPEPGDWYSATEVHWRANPQAGPGEGLEFGFEVEMFAPGSMSDKIWHAGPFITYGLSDKLGLGFTWHEKSDKFGGDFIRLTTTFLFF